MDEPGFGIFPATHGSDEESYNYMKHNNKKNIFVFRIQYLQDFSQII